MNILQRFSFDIRIFVFQIINFLIIAFIVKKFFYKPLHKILYKRQLQIKKSIMTAKHIKLVMNSIKQEKSKIINNAQEDASKLLFETQQYIEKLKQKALIDINNQAKQIIDEAVNVSNEEFNNMRRDIEHLSVNVAETMIKKILSDLFSEPEKHQLIVRALKQIHVQYDQNTN